MRVLNDLSLSVKQAEPQTFTRSSIHPKALNFAPVVPHFSDTKSPENRMSALSPGEWSSTFCTSSQPYNPPTHPFNDQTLMCAASKTLSRRKIWVVCFTENHAWLWVLCLEAFCLKKENVLNFQTWSIAEKMGCWSLSPEKFTTKQSPASPARKMMWLGWVGGRHVQITSLGSL